MKISNESNRKKKNVVFRYISVDRHRLVVFLYFFLFYLGFRFVCLRRLMTAELERVRAGGGKEK